MNKNVLSFILISILAGLSIGSIRKAEDPIRDTQTNPILYEQKKEEEKDGKKGPLMYHVKNNPRESFFIDSPIGKEKKSSPKEFVTEQAPSSAETASWWEEQPTTSPEIPPVETVSESLPEPSLESEKIQNPEAAEPPAAATEAESAPSGKGDDYWW